MRDPLIKVVPAGHKHHGISKRNIKLKGVFAKNERGYRRNAKNKSF